MPFLWILNCFSYLFCCPVNAEGNIAYYINVPPKIKEGLSYIPLALHNRWYAIHTFSLCIVFSCPSSSFSIWVKICSFLDELPWVHYESVGVRLSVRPSVCRQIKRTSTQTVTSLFSTFIHIWIKQDVEKKVMKRKFQISIFWIN